MLRANRGIHAHVQASKPAYWSEHVHRARIKPPERAAAGRNKRQVLRDLASRLTTESPQKDRTASCTSVGYVDYICRKSRQHEFIA